MKFQSIEKLKYICLGAILGAIIFFVGSISENIKAQDVTHLEQLMVNHLYVRGGITIGSDPLNPSIDISEVVHKAKKNGQIIISGETGGLLFIQSKNPQSGSVSITVGDPNENPEYPALLKDAALIRVIGDNSNIHKGYNSGVFHAVVWGGVWKDKQ